MRFMEPTTSGHSSPSETQTQVRCNSTTERDIDEQAHGELSDLCGRTGLTPESWESLVNAEVPPAHHAIDQVANTETSNFTALGVVASEPQLQDNMVYQDLGRLSTDNSIFHVDMPSAAFLPFMSSVEEGGFNQNMIDIFANPFLRVIYEPQEAPLLQTLYTLIDQRFMSAAGASLSEQIDDMSTLMEDYLKLVGGFGIPKMSVCLSTLPYIT